jgi:type I restriction enzyme S subunit
MGRIKRGYKQTEIGEIPEDWELKSLGNIAPLQRGFDLPTSQLKTGIYPVVYSNGIMNYHYQATGKAPGVITGRSGTIGKVHFIETDYWAHNTSLWVTDFKDNYPKFIYYLYVFIGLERFATGSGVPTLNRNDIHSFMVAIPNPDEQRRIAETLSDADAQITALAELIAKKRDIKQGVMQQLLTRQKRLKGFSNEWSKKPLWRIGETYGGLVGKSKKDFYNDGFAYIPFMNIMNNPIIDIGYFDFVQIRQGESQNKVLQGDILFNGSSETPEEVGMCSILLNNIPDLFLNSFCFGFRLNKDSETDGLYLVYFFRSSIGRELIYSLAQGATRYNLSKTNFIKLEIPFPSLDEQIVIANILSDIDTELDGLETEHDKLVMIKQGMMHELLTGKVRLI